MNQEVINEESQSFIHQGVISQPNGKAVPVKSLNKVAILYSSRGYLSENGHEISGLVELKESRNPLFIKGLSLSC